ncbi:hypothetical protein HYFRA_00004740 [Hymenoscyphus fraxineus]|uniref:Uncharacterized protein n=1 Tax=Hymenoscyphus fraxineus TaxID=746836 RepID=A0A9N9PIR4_9HELO|nr:hypothetical protein HYFRA_00004740 [Hymenoscyphus fraxineus]
MKPFEFIEEKRIYRDEEIPPFGDLSFDHYLLENWNIASIKSELEQKEEMVRGWLALGGVGRIKYHKKVLSQYQEAAAGVSPKQPLFPTIPPGIPQHFQTPQQRAELLIVEPMMMWVRTWFGNEKTTRDEADGTYKKLCKHADGFGAGFIEGNFAFEDDLEFEDRTGGPTGTGITPSYVLALLKRYPDVIDGYHGPSEKSIAYIEEGNMVGKQKGLMMVADKIACETGAVLLIGINDFGEMLPKRLRIKADDVVVFHANWTNQYQDLEENGEEGEVGELCCYDGDDAWALS